MDLLDKSIVIELMFNSRISCQDIAEKYNSSRGIVRKRIKKLQEIGVIEHFTAWYSFAMVDANYVFGHISLDKTADKENVLKFLEKNSMIFVVIPMTSVDVVVHSTAIGIDGISELGSSIRKLDGVEEAELHIIQVNRGKKTELKKTHLRVLSVLFKNSRLSSTEIARKTGLSPRRVRRIIDEIITDGAVVLGTVINPAAGSGINFYAKTRWDERKSDSKTIAQKTKEIFPIAIWESYTSVSEPVMFTRFVVEHIKDVERISDTITQLEGVTSNQTLVFYPARISSILTRERLKEDILGEGFMFSVY